MNRKFLKFNIAIVFAVVLFAGMLSISYAEAINYADILERIESEEIVSFEYKTVAFKDINKKLKVLVANFDSKKLEEMANEYEDISSIDVQNGTIIFKNNKNKVIYRINMSVTYTDYAEITKSGPYKSEHENAFEQTGKKLPVKDGRITFAEAAWKYNDDQTIDNPSIIIKYEDSKKKELRTSTLLYNTSKKTFSYKATLSGSQKKVDLWSGDKGDFIVRKGSFIKANSDGTFTYSFKVKNEGTYQIEKSNGKEYDNTIIVSSTSKKEAGKTIYRGALDLDGKASNNCIVLKPNIEYEWTFQSDEATLKVSYTFLHKGTTEGSLDYNNPENKNQKSDKVNGAEELITRVFLVMGDVFLKGIRMALGSELSIDTLVFNRYEGTKISFFSGKTSLINNKLIEVVNYWYKALSNFTYVIYIIILVYIGIMIIVTSGTPRQDKAKSYFADWIIGLVIFMFLPHFGFPLLFKLNDALVEYIGRNSTTFQTYYNLIDKYEVSDEIDGGDSYTKLVEKINAAKVETQGEQDQAVVDSKKAIDLAMNKVREKMSDNKYLDAVRETGVTYIPEGAIDETMDYFREEVYPYFYERFKLYRDEGKTKESAQNNAYDDVTNKIAPLKDKYPILAYMFKNFSSGLKKAIYDSFETIYSTSLELAEIEQDIESLNKDIMGTMRSLAGSTLRLVYAIVWLVLIFQLIGLTILYYKRIFTIALLIAIFPLIMLTYCIDKMADGAAQTFSMWMKELLSNIFIQTVHAIIYAVLIEMGLQIYDGGTENWLYLVGAMFLLLPAESIMKEIFDLNGTTLNQIGGTFTKFAMGTGALISLANAGKSGKDASIKSANENRMKRLQNSQNRADKKAKAREYRSTYQLDKERYAGIGGKATLMGDRLKGRENVKYTAKPVEKTNSIREKMYHGATATRKAYAKIAPKAGRIIRGVRNVSAVTAGTIYAASGGDVQSLVQGAAVARGLSGKTKNLKKKADLKTEVKAAYNRKKE